MTTPRHLLSVLVAVLLAAAVAMSVTGHAASLGVTSAQLDTFAADQPAPTTTTSTTSQTAPTLIAVSDFGGTTDGRFEGGDWIEFSLDQPVDPSTVPSTTTVVLTDPPGNTNDRLSVVGVLGAATDLGSNAYLSGNNRTASFAATVTLGGGGTVIRVTLGACSGFCSASDLQQGSGNVTFALASTIEGTNGLHVTGSVTKTGYRVF